MSDIFSHPAATPADEGRTRADLHHTVAVPATVDHAWAGLKEHLHLWWPADLMSRWGESSFFDLEDSALVETSAEDDENVWGEVIDGRPGEWLELKWRVSGSTSSTQVRLCVHPIDGANSAVDGSDPERSVVGEGSNLSVSHRGWTTEDPEDVYTFYMEFWPAALARYRRFMGGK
jgi:hypothetical protein